MAVTNRTLDKNTRLDITTDAVTTATVVEIGSDGKATGTITSIAVSTTSSIGPNNSTKTYRITYTNTEPTFSEVSDSIVPSSMPASSITSGTIAHERGGLEADVSSYSGIPWISGGTTAELKMNFAATTAPTTTDDSAAGYAVGSRWLDTTNDKAYVCLDDTATSAVWTEITLQGDVTASSTTTFTNKTLDADGTGNTVSNIDTGNFTSTAITGLTAPTLASGDVLLIQDVDDSNNYKKTTAGDIAGLAGGGGAWTLDTSADQRSSAVASVTWANIGNQDEAIFRIVCSELIPATDARIPQFYAYDSGGQMFASGDYHLMEVYTDSGASANTFVTSATGTVIATNENIGNATGEGAFIVLDIYNPGGTGAYKYFEMRYAAKNSVGTTYAGTLRGSINTTDALTDVSFQFSSGNANGMFNSYYLTEA